jgi:hypothetical protein
MKNLHINYISESNKAKETLFNNKEIPKTSNASVAKWLKNATDEEIEALAIDSGYTEDTIIIPNTYNTEDVIDVESEPMEAIDSKGRPISVNVYNLPFLKTRNEDVYKAGVKTGQKIRSFIFAFGNATIKTYSNMLAVARSNGELLKGDIIPFRADTCELTHVPAKGDSKAYSFWQGATFEAGSEIMQDAREQAEEREEAFAEMSKEGQAKTLDRIAETESDDFLNRFVKKKAKVKAGQ